MITYAISMCEIWIILISVALHFNIMFSIKISTRSGGNRIGVFTKCELWRFVFFFVIVIRLFRTLSHNRPPMVERITSCIYITHSIPVRNKAERKMSVLSLEIVGLRASTKTLDERYHIQLVNSAVATAPGHDFTDFVCRKIKNYIL